MKLITYVINSLLLLPCITTIAMEKSLIGKKATQSHIMKKINEQAMHDKTITVMNMVRENDRNKKSKTFDGIDPKRPIIKLYACY